jgi:uncharacterized membrane protein YadS
MEGITIMSTINRKWYSGMLTTEDWWAVWLGLTMLFAGLASIWGYDLVGWMAKTKPWVWGDFAWDKILKPVSYKEWHPLQSLLVTYLVFTALTGLGAWAMKLDMKKFLAGWTIIFFITWTVWIIGSEAHFNAHSKEFEKLGITWGLALGGGFSYILALTVGLLIGNFFKGFAAFLQEAAKPEWFIKTAIVYLGVEIGMMTMKDSSKTTELAIAGMAATFVAYMLFWPIIYALSRKIFRLSRAASAVLSSGISICGVSAAIATAGAIRAKPILPVMVSMLVVVFAMIELILLPTLYAVMFPDQPIVNGAAMGMTVKTDGADAAAGAILDELMRANATTKLGISWEAGWILSAAVMTKIWIDMFVGLWAFILALIWVYKVEHQSAKQSTVPLSEIWHRFPKFVLGYFLSWFIYLGIALLLPDLVSELLKQSAGTVGGPMRSMMFMLTFVSIGIITDFSKLKGMGRLTVLYAVALFLIIAPIAYVVAWIFHHGMMPPVVVQ